MGIHAKKNLHGNPCKKILRIMELAITQPFFELQTRDFAWKFVWTIPTNYEQKIQNKMAAKYYIIMQILNHF